MAGEKILIIDPSPDDVRPLIEGLLDPEGYIVVHALDGEEGLSQALHGKPHLIIAEFAAPRRSGLDVLTQLRKAKQDIPFILTGVSGSVETFRRALRMGVVDYLIKPLDLGEMRSAIARALAKRRPPQPSKETGLLARGFEQVNRQLEKRVWELSVLHDIGKAVVASVGDLEKLLNRIVEAAVYLTGAEEGFLLLVDEKTHELYMRAGQGLGKKFASGFQVKSEDSLPLQVVQTGKPVMISSVTNEEKFKLKTGYLVKALLHVPLKLREEVIGVLSVDNKIANKSFSDSDLHLLSALADYASIAIDNARLYKRAEAEAAKLAKLLSEQKTQPASPSQPANNTSLPLLETTALNWTVQKLETQQKVATEGLKETQKLSRELSKQLSAVEKLVQRWRNQQAEFKELAHHITGSEGTNAEGRIETAVILSTNQQRILDKLEEGLIFTDRQGVVTLTNKVAAQMLNTDPLVDRDLREVSPSSHWARSVDRLWNDEALDKEMGQEIALWSNERLIRACFVPRLEGDQAAGWAVILRDMSQERAGQLTHTDLTTNISQKLRTPMTILTSYTDLLLAEIVGLLVPVQRRLLERMRVNLTRMGETLNNLMAVPPTVHKEGQETFQAADLRTVVQKALSSANPWLADKELNIKLQLADNLPQAAAEPDCVCQMVTNLLQNAIRVTPPSGAIKIQAEIGKSDGPAEHPSHLVVSVYDQGGGIAPQFLGVVFERFYSEDEQPIPGLGGKGAELSAVKKLVETFGGRVWVETEPGVGSTFSFILPTTDN